MITKYDRFINEKMELIIEGLISGSGDLTLKLREISNNNENEYRIREISKKANIIKRMDALKNFLFIIFIEKD